MEKNSDIKIKEAEHVVIIDLPDKSFTTFSTALTYLDPKKYEQKKILLVQSVEKENEPFRVVVVFHF